MPLFISIAEVSGQSQASGSEGAQASQQQRGSGATGRGKGKKADKLDRMCKYAVQQVNYPQ